MQEKSRRRARMALLAVSLGFAAVSLATLGIDPRVTERWGFSMTEMDIIKLLPLSPIPLAGLVLVALTWRDLFHKTGPEWRPYVYTAGIFLSGYLGLAVSLFPNLVPFQVDLWQAAARDNALALMLVGAAVMIPVILIYTGYVYSLFWGKVDPDEAYHD